jgi:hypothetical protein
MKAMRKFGCSRQNAVARSLKTCWLTFPLQGANSAAQALGRNVDSPGRLTDGFRFADLHQVLQLLYLQAFSSFGDIPRLVNQINYTIFLNFIAPPPPLSTGVGRIF